MCSVFVVVYVDVAVNNIKTFSISVEMQQQVPFAMLSRYKVFVLLSTIVSMKYYECVRSFAFVIRQANRIFSASYYIVIRGVSGSTTCFHIIS
jgi:hypothetical protein